jgi:hypothetical protein
MTPVEELLELAERLQVAAEKITTVAPQLDRLEVVCNQVSKSWSQSWLGYHSRVYYQNFEPPPTGARFSVEWGLNATETYGAWCEYDFDYAVAEIKKKAGNPDLKKCEKLTDPPKELFEESQSAIESILVHALESRPSDTFLAALLDQVKEKEIIGFGDFMKACSVPSRRQIFDWCVG